MRAGTLVFVIPSLSVSARRSNRIIITMKIKHEFVALSGTLVKAALTKLYPKASDLIPV